MMPDRHSPSPPPLPRRIAVAQKAQQYHVLAVLPIAAGEAIVEIDGDVTDRPSRFSVQIDDASHIEVAAGEDLATSIERSPWRFLNHSCAPNAAIRGRQVVATAAIAAGEEITFDYNTTEFDLAAPFACHCGAGGCLGSIRGFVHLRREQRLQRRADLAPHLLRRLVDDPIAPVEHTAG